MIEKGQREEMAKLAAEILRLTEGGVAQPGLVDAAHRLAVIVKAVTTTGNQGRATLIMTCVKCEKKFATNEEHRCENREYIRSGRY